jgi:hypothetical protein
MKRGTMRAARPEQCRDACVQCHETTSVSDGQAEQIGVRDLFVPDKKVRRNAVIENTDLILPERYASRASQQRQAVLTPPWASRPPE